MIHPRATCHIQESKCYSRRFCVRLYGATRTISSGNSKLLFQKIAAISSSSDQQYPKATVLCEKIPEFLKTSTMLSHTNALLAHLVYASGLPSLHNSSQRCTVHQTLKNISAAQCPFCLYKHHAPFFSTYFFLAFLLSSPMKIIKQSN